MGPIAVSTDSFTESFEEVECAEAQWIAERRSAANIDARAPIVGLGLSGGGIRSAAFNLGVLQALNRHGLLSRIDYLSSVSGGGYIGSCLTWLRAHIPASSPQQLGAIPLSSGHGTVLDWIRAHGKYLIAGNGLSGWTLAASILAGTLLNVFVLLPLFLLVIGLASGDWFAAHWPAELALPGAPRVHGHDGFMLIFLLGLLLLGLYLLATLLFALSTALPPMRRISADFYMRRRLGQILAAGVIAIAIGALPILTGIEETAVVFLKTGGARELARHLSWLLPIITGAASLWRSSQRSSGSPMLAVVGLSLLLYGGFTALYHLAHHTDLLATQGFYVWVAASLLLAFVCDINAISMHSYYRSRLAAAFLPEVNTSQRHLDADTHPMMFRLADIGPGNGAPYHIINTTLNTTSSKNATYRARNGESFILAPLYCGSRATGYRRTSDYLRGQLTLSTAFSVSGAAIDPDMSQTRARPISFLMTLLNVRLGFWTDNPRRIVRRLRWPAWYGLMLREMLGIGLSETQAKIHLADGGHFDNLGLYELLRRRCRFIIVSDAGADPDCTLADLGQAVQRARADLGADVRICADRLAGERNLASRELVHLIGTVTYADGTTGHILYLKALLRQDLTADIYAYWRLNPDFPNQPTDNQFFGEMQFDSYRELGLQLMSGIIEHSRGGAIEALFAATTPQRAAVPA
jgi:hypothetical protein